MVLLTEEEIPLNLEEVPMEENDTILSGNMASYNLASKLLQIIQKLSIR
jgi:hypothetical protein